MKRADAEATFTQVPLRDLFGFVLRGMPLAALLTAVALGGVWFVTQQRPTTFTAVAYLLSTRPEFTPTVVRGIIPGTLDPALYRAAVTDGPVLESVRRDWIGPGQLPADHTLLSNLRVLSDNQLRSSVVRVEYRSASPEQAAAIANGVAFALTAWDAERTLRPLQDWRDRLNRELTALSQQLADSPAGTEARQMLQAERDQRVRDLAELEATLPVSQLSLLSAAETPAEPDSRGLLTAMAVTGVVAALIAYLVQLIPIALNDRPKPIEPVRTLETDRI